MSASNMTFDCRTEPDFTTTCDACGHSHAVSGRRPEHSAITSGERVYAVIVNGEARFVYHDTCVSIEETRLQAVEEDGTPVEATYEVVGGEGRLTDPMVR
jgi:hypothetical protein